ncbi:MAG: DUF2478 domain-containing protein [Candidatus Brocadiae bacterium]|nr:DUF2478 domain-containing protein [Candidatus Brocadiia bacterium]
MEKQVFCLIGASGTGKTTQAWNLANQIVQNGYLVGGILAPGTFCEEKRFSFDIVDFMTQEKRFLAKKGMPSSITIGPFGFSQDGFSFGYNAIQKAISQRVDLLILDEIGPLELQNKGWFSSLKDALNSEVPNILITMRPGLFLEVQKTFFQNHRTWECPVCESSPILAFFPKRSNL